MLSVSIITLSVVLRQNCVGLQTDLDNSVRKPFQVGAKCFKSSAVDRFRMFPGNSFGPEEKSNCLGVKDGDGQKG